MTVAELHSFILKLALRVYNQSNLLSRRAERPTPPVLTETDYCPL